jgi:hyaluronan synthase
MFYPFLEFKFLKYYLPFGFIGLYRWSIILIRLYISRKYYRPISGEPLLCTTTIVAPVYNEPLQSFEEALQSWIKNNPTEIILVIDQSSTDCIFLAQNYAEKNSSIKVIITPKPGKRPALVDGIAVASGKIIALVDSDVVLADNCLQEVLKAFSNPKVGAVTTRQSAIAPKTIPEILQDIFWSLRYNEEVPALVALNSCLPTLSGRAAFYYGNDLKVIAPSMVDELFLGKNVISGEDKYLTRSLHSLGRKSFYQSTARIYTNSTTDFKTLTKQRLRWARNSWRSDMRLVSLRWFWQNHALVFHTFNNMIVTFISILTPFYLILTLVTQNYLLSLWLLAWILVSRFIRLFLALDEQRWQIKYFPLFAISMLFFQYVKIYGLATCNKQGWITRWDPSRNVSQSMTDRLYSLGLTVITILIVVLTTYFITPLHYLINEIK